ncbi:hypothetical protein [Microbulbifer sp.]|uniref:hypothetical protein n=1 Tax=Microbulbifer sp. TaxID=1908541 RepID=UPI002F945A58
MLTFDDGTSNHAKHELLIPFVERETVAGASAPHFFGPGFPGLFLPHLNRKLN